MAAAEILATGRPGSRSADPPRPKTMYGGLIPHVYTVIIALWPR